MAITSSGTLYFASFNAEFGLGYNLSSYYGCDPYLPVPRSGSISFSDFYSSDNRTAELTCGKSSDGYYSGFGRAGWAEANGSGFLTASESSENRNAFGSISKTLYMSTGQRIVGLYAADQSASTSNIVRYIALTKKGTGNTSTTGGFTTLKIRCNNKFWRYGDPTPAGQSAATDFEMTFNRTSGVYGYVGNTYDSSGPTYAWRWTTSSMSGADDASKAYLGLNLAQNGGYISFKIIY